MNVIHGLAFENGLLCLSRIRGLKDDSSRPTLWEPGMSPVFDPHPVHPFDPGSNAKRTSQDEQDGRDKKETRLSAKLRQKDLTANFANTPLRAREWHSTAVPPPFNRRIAQLLEAGRNAD